MKNVSLILVFAFLIPFGIEAQELELEKTYDITGLADVGDIANFQFDVATDIYEVTYILPTTPGMVRIEQYKFDKDFNFLGDEKEDLNVESAQEKYTWWNYNGEVYQDEMMSVYEKDRLVLKKDRLTFTYNWKKMIYSVKSASDGFFYITADNGENYFHYRNWWTAEDLNSTYILCSIISKEDDLSQYENFHFIKMNKSMEVVKDVEINFDYPQEVVYPRFLDDKSESRWIEDPLEEDIFCLFAPKNEGKKSSDPNPCNYTYLRIDKDLDLIDRISFSTPTNFWSVDDYIYDGKSGSCYFLGASLTAPGQYFSDLAKTEKFSGFQIMKIANHQVEYVTSTGLAEFAANKILPPLEKKADSYDGKKFQISNYTVTQQGNLLVAGQNYSTYRNSQTMQKITSYGDCFSFGFDPRGKLIAQYIFNWRGFGANMPALQEIFVGDNPANIYWFLMIVAYVKIDIWGGFGPSWVDIYSSQMSKIDLSAKTMSNFYNHQVDKEAHKNYYLSSTMPYFITPDHKLVLFGSQSMSAGKRLWFARMRLD